MPLFRKKYKKTILYSEGVFTVLSYDLYVYWIKKDINWLDCEYCVKKVKQDCQMLFLGNTNVVKYNQHNILLHKPSLIYAW